jgi:dienelactone hydrolase
MVSTRGFRMGCAAVIVLVAAAGCATATTPSVRIRERSVRVPAQDVQLTGLLFTSEAAPPPGTRRPAIVLMHGCSGMLTTRGELSARHRDWSERFARWGFVALALDSFGPRGVSSLCELKERPAATHPWNARTADAYAALEYLVRRADVDADRVFVLGWSHGGSTVTGVVRPGALGVRAGGPRFRAAIAFYPGCARPLRQRDYRTTMPMLILQGEADDWSPAAPCVELGDRLKNNRFPVTVVVYPGAYHGFDHPGQRLVLLPNVYNPRVPGERGAHVGTDQPSRLKAIDETKRFVELNMAR